MHRDREEERQRLAEFEDHPHEHRLDMQGMTNEGLVAVVYEGLYPPHGSTPSAKRRQAVIALSEFERRMKEAHYTLHGGRDEGDKGVLRWLRFYEELASIWAYEARKSREVIHALLETKSESGEG